MPPFITFVSIVLGHNAIVGQIIVKKLDSEYMKYLSLNIRFLAENAHYGTVSVRKYFVE